MASKGPKKATDKAPSDFQRKVLALVGRGLKVSAVAKANKVSKPTIYLWMRRWPDAVKAPPADPNGHAQNGHAPTEMKSPIEALRELRGRAADIVKQIDEALEAAATFQRAFVVRNLGGSDAEAPRG